jgi:ABC-type lipoprotein release transport system permease subunit
MEKIGGGVTNVPLRGVQPMSLDIHGGALKLVEGRWLRFGSDEVVVGRALSERIRNCRVGDTLRLNTVPFKVVGVFDNQGVYGGEVWGDVERMMEALERPFFQRVLARLQPDQDLEKIAKDLEADPRHPCKFQSERDYMASQTRLLGFALTFLALFLTVIMGLAAVLGAIITMLASVAARTHEIGVLLALGYKREAIFFAFLFEALLIGLIGGALGVLLVLPLNGTKTGAMNWNTFTDISFEFQVTPGLMAVSVSIALLLGIVGGVLPALRAALLKPVEAFRAL